MVFRLKLDPLLKQPLFVAVIRIGAMGRFLSHSLAMIGVGMLLGPEKSHVVSFMLKWQPCQPLDTFNLKVWCSCICLQANPGGGFKYFLFSSLVGEDSHFD